MLDLLKIGLAGCFLLAITMAVLLSMPSSRLRDFLMPIIGWCFAVCCGAYLLSPMDLVPDFIPFAGWIDDGGALLAGIASARAAMTAGKEHR